MQLRGVSKTYPNGVHGIDPYNLLDWKEGDNIEEMTVEQPVSAAR